MKRILPKSEFGRNVLTLMTGTTVAQAIPLAVAPILTRIYTPADFGMFSLYFAMASILAVIATGRYELAIMLPPEEDDAANVAVLSMLIALLISMLVFVVVFVFNVQLAQLLGNPEIAHWLYLLPISVLMSGCFNAMNYWNNRKKAFRRLSYCRILQSGGTAGTQLALGQGAAFSGGLIVGSLCGQSFSVAALAFANWSEDRLKLKNISSASMLANARSFIKFPKVSVWGALVDTAAVQMPIFLITKVFGTVITGLFGLTFRVLSMPMTLISSSLSQVMFQKITTLHNEKPEQLFGFILRIFILLLGIAIPFVLVMNVFGVEIFSFVFGRNWSMAGSFAAILSIAVAVRFAVSPLSAVLVLNHNVQKGVLWQFLYFCTLTVTLLLASGLNIELFLWVFVIHEVILYGLYLYVILAASRTVPAGNIG